MSRSIFRPISSLRSYSTKSLSVVGSGQMGVGIAYVAALKAEVPVVLVDSNEKALSKGSAFVDKLLSKAVTKGKIANDVADKVRGRITTSADLGAAVSAADFVIEAVPESLGLKTKLFGEFAKLAPKHAILGTNTSSISLTKIAASAKGAEDRVIGVHFMNPVPVQPGVEIIRSLQTSDSVLASTLEFVKRMGKVTSTSQDVPGFLANRMLIPYLNEAIIALETGVGKREDIDSIMKNGCAMPMGPLALADFIGLDTVLAIAKVLHNDLGDTKYRPSVLLAKMVDAGYLGVKSGRGFYEYKQ